MKTSLRHLSPCDLLIVEGFKYAPIPKLKMWRAETGESLLNDPHFVAIATDAKVDAQHGARSAHADAVAAFVVSHLELA